MKFLDRFRRTPKIERIAVYSSYFGKHEPLNVSAMGIWDNYNKFLFTTDPTNEYPGATVKVISDEGLEPHNLSRKVKLNPHLYLSGYDWVIYIDNRASLKIHPAEIVKSIRSWEKNKNWAGRYLFRHAKRDCAYDEAFACVQTGVISAEKYREIVAFFESEMFPRNYGLFVNTMLVQRMGDAATDRFNEQWFGYLDTLCYRDQVSLSYAIWDTGYRPHILPFKQQDFIEWPIFSRSERERFRASQNSVVIPDGNSETTT